MHKTFKRIRYNKTLRTVVFSAAVGFITAIVIHFFNLAAESAFDLTERVYEHVRGNLVFLAVLIPAVAILAILAGIISKYSGVSRGGGVPFTEGIVRGRLSYKWYFAIIGMATATLISILIGLPLGCEGPSIFIGGALGYGFSSIFKHSSHEKRLLSTAGACTGLAVAFNTPLAGIIFSVEEAHRKFSPTMLLPAMVAVMVGIITKKLIFGDKIYLAAYGSMDVSFNMTHIAGAIIVGAVCGLFGCLFNYAIIRKVAPLDRVPVMWRILIPAAVALVCCLVLPYTMGVGKSLFLDIAGIGAGIIALTLFAKFFMIIMASRSGASGGIFIPMMSLGAMAGALISRLMTVMGFENSIMFLTLMGACAFFAAAVRTPLTAVVLSFEITGFSLSGIFPITAAVMMAYLVAEFIGTKPLYENMLDNLIEREHKNTQSPPVESRFCVSKNSIAEHKQLRDLILPHNFLIVTVNRGGEVLFPDGDIKFFAGDILSVTHQPGEEDIEEFRRIFEASFSGIKESEEKPSAK